MRKPCKECPFRRTSLPGWIGAHEDAREIVDIVMADQRFPCHMRVNDRIEVGEDFGVASTSAEVCAGSALFLSNQLKRSRHRDVSAAQTLLGKSGREEVFSNASEFCEHHKRR